MSLKRQRWHRRDRIRMRAGRALLARRWVGLQRAAFGDHECISITRWAGHTIKEHG